MGKFTQTFMLFQKSFNNFHNFSIAIKLKPSWMNLLGFYFRSPFGSPFGLIPLWIPTYRKKRFSAWFVVDLSLSFRKKGWELRYLNERPICDKFKKNDKNFKTYLKSSRRMIYLFISLISSCSISVTDEERWFYQGWFHQSGSRPNRDC